MTCSSDNDCNYLGVCIANKCECHIYADGSNCSISYKDELGANIFDLWRFFFLSCFTMLTLAISFHIYFFWRLKMLLHLKGVTHLFLWTTAFLRFLYFATDPMWQTRVIPYLLEQLIFGLGFFFLFAAYLTVALYWVGSYHSGAVLGGTNSKLKWLLANTRALFIAQIAIFFVLELVYRVLNGVHLKIEGSTSIILDDIYYVYTGFSISIISGTFLIYGLLLIRRLTVDHPDNVSTLPIRNLTIVSVVVSVTTFITVSALVIIVVTKSLYTPIGAIISFSVEHVLELILATELAFFMRPKYIHTRSYAPTPAQRENIEHGNNSGAMDSN